MDTQINWLERLGKWRTVLTGRLLGTRLITDQQGRAGRDLFDKVNALRADARTLPVLLRSKQIVSAEEFAEALGTKFDASKQFAGDLFATLLELRAEVSAVTFLLQQKGVVTAEEFTRVYMTECKWLCEDYERQYPGFRATDVGLVIYDPRQAAETTRGWPL